MEKVIEKLLWADITIWSFPLYYYTVPGGLKNLIDRQLPMELPFMVEREDGIGNGSHPSRYDMSGKKTVVISTCGFYTAEGNYNGVVSLFDHMCGKDEYTAIFCGQGELFRVPELSKRTGEYLTYVKQAGAEYVKGGIAIETKKELNRLLYPKEVFEKIFEEDVDPEVYVEEHGLKTVNDEGALEEVLKKVIADNPKAAKDYHSGKEKALGALVGQTMKAMKGKADPGLVNRKLREMI